MILVGSFEAHDGVNNEKYTIALGQDCMTIYSEFEDVIFNYAISCYSYKSFSCFQ